MTGWRPTAAHARAWAVTTLAVVLAVAVGRPVLLVVAAPFALLAALGEIHRPPTAPPAVTAAPDRRIVREGSGTVLRLQLTGDPTPVEHLVVARSFERDLSGATYGSGLLRNGTPALGIRADRWGERDLGSVSTGLTTVWGGYRAGPDTVGSGRLTVLPHPERFGVRTSVPHPLGLVGVHQSRRNGEGLEYAATRPFVPGDRLRRVNWRQSVRTGDLHVDTTLTQEDTEVTLVVDGLIDLQPIDGSATSLDRAVRAAAAIGDHHLRSGDRVALRVMSGTPRQLPLGTGTRHAQRLLAELARVRPSTPRVEQGPVRVGVSAGGIAIVLSPMLHTRVAGLAATLVQAGVSVLVVDTLPAGTLQIATRRTDPAVAALAWRMRRLERVTMLDRLRATGCPVVPWRGPGTLDEVLRRLDRQTRAPRMRVR